MKGLTSVSLNGGALTDSGRGAADGAHMFTVEQEGIGGYASIHLKKSEAAQWAAVLTEYAESAP